VSTDVAQKPQRATIDILARSFLVFVFESTNKFTAIDCIANYDDVL